MTAQAPAGCISELDSSANQSVRKPVWSSLTPTVVERTSVPESSDLADASDFSPSGHSDQQVLRDSTCTGAGPVPLMTALCVARCSWVGKRKQQRGLSSHAGVTVFFTGRHVLACLAVTITRVSRNWDSADTGRRCARPTRASRSLRLVRAHVDELTYPRPA